MNKKTIALDMDGVIVNWSKGAAERIRNDKVIMDRLKEINFKIDWDNFSGYDVEDGLTKYNMEVRGMVHKKAKRAAKGRFWKPFNGDVAWWANLEWMPDGEQLFNYLNELRDSGKITELNILTSPAQDPACPVGKRKWLARTGVASCVDNIYIDRDKWKYTDGGDDILIDDTKKKIDGWLEHGGTGILHTGTITTIERLRELGL